MKKNLWVRLWNDESALSGVEYGILAGVIAVVVGTGAWRLRDKINEWFLKAAGAGDR